MQPGEMFLLICSCFSFAVASSHMIQDQQSVEYILSEILDLKTKQTNCDAEVSTLKDAMSDLKKLASQLQTRNNILEQEISALQHGLLLESEEDTSTIQDNDAEAKQRILDSSFRNRRLVSRGEVAFTVGISVPDLTHLGEHHTIIFDKTITNIGNAFSTNSGIFQAPLKGAYVFTLTVRVTSHFSEYLEIVVDGSAKNDLFADASSVDDDISTTKQWVLDINRGSEVWIRTSSFRNKGQIHGNMHTLFSGFLLFERS